MTFTREKTYKRKDGSTSTYYYRVESVWKDGRSQQKVVKYLGKSPNTQEVIVNPSDAGALAEVLFSTAPSQKRVRETLAQLGLRTTGRVTKVSLVYNPPLKQLALRVE
jgi:hypothetical protein